MKPLKFKRTKTKNKVDFYFDEKKKKATYLVIHFKNRNNKKLQKQKVIVESLLVNLESYCCFIC